MDRAKIVGHIVFYKDELDGGAFIPVSNMGLLSTIATMMIDREDATLCIEPVDKVPEWVEQ